MLHASVQPTRSEHMTSARRARRITLILSALSLVATAGAQAAPTWLAPVNITSTGVDNLAVASSRDRESTAIYAQWDGTEETVGVSTRPPGGNWSPGTVLSAPGGAATSG
jgi:hypothetical protein